MRFRGASRYVLALASTWAVFSVGSLTALGDWANAHVVGEDYEPFLCGGFQGTVGHQSTSFNVAGACRALYGTDISGLVGPVPHQAFEAKANGIGQSWGWYGEGSHPALISTGDVLQAVSGSGTSILMPEGYFEGIFEVDLGDVSDEPATGVQISNQWGENDQELYDTDDYDVDGQQFFWTRQYELSETDNRVKVLARIDAAATAYGELVEAMQSVDFDVLVTLEQPH